MDQFNSNLKEDSVPPVLSEAIIPREYDSLRLQETTRGFAGLSLQGSISKSISPLHKIRAQFDDAAIRPLQDAITSSKPHDIINRDFQGVPYSVISPQPTGMRKTSADAVLTCNSARNQQSHIDEPALQPSPHNTATTSVVPTRERTSIPEPIIPSPHGHNITPTTSAHIFPATPTKKKENETPSTPTDDSLKSLQVEAADILPSTPTEQQVKEDPVTPTSYVRNGVRVRFADEVLETPGAPVKASRMWLS